MITAHPTSIARSAAHMIMAACGTIQIKTACRTDKKYSPFTKRPVEKILRLAEGYGIAEVTLNENCSDIGKTLFESSFRQKDILIIAIERASKVIPAPHASDKLLINVSQQVQSIDLRGLFCANIWNSEN